MAAENESPDEKTRRLLHRAQGAIAEIVDRKSGNVLAYGESRVVLIWKAGAIAEIKIEDSASLR